MKFSEEPHSDACSSPITFSTFTSSAGEDKVLVSFTDEINVIGGVARFSIGLLLNDNFSVFGPLLSK
ncbi:hypothetical protein HanPI659440_Chr09g0320001 [Helianthus annuus]|nr:hypothetical protein HanPI659440_Chr09g0320001 [Helianthus annuus]